MLSYIIIFLFQSYLSKFGYLSQTSKSANNDITTAIKKFQKFFGIPVTGKLDEKTLEEMQKPRCGVPDLGEDADRMRVKRYSTSFPKWPKPSLKYYLSYGHDLSHNDQARIIAKAFKMWSNVAPKLRFTRTDEGPGSRPKTQVPFIDIINVIHLQLYNIDFC